MKKTIFNLLNNKQVLKALKSLTTELQKKNQVKILKTILKPTEELNKSIDMTKMKYEAEELALSITNIIMGLYPRLNKESLFTIIYTRISLLQLTDMKIKKAVIKSVSRYEKILHAEYIKNLKFKQLVKPMTYHEAIAYVKANPKYRLLTKEDMSLEHIPEAISTLISQKNTFWLQSQIQKNSECALAIAYSLKEKNTQITNILFKLPIILLEI